MASVPELDQVAEARRRIAETTRYPRAYWVVFGLALVLFAGVPIWMSLLPVADHDYLSWAFAAVCLASAAYSLIRRRRSGVRLPRQISAYPSAQRIWIVVAAVTVGGFFGIQALVNHDHRDIAFVVLPVVALAVFLGQVAIRRAIRDDLEAGRVVP
jgi:uncharacterized membrane protein YfcA